MNKKAITPLISSVSLLLFAIGLGILVMSWGQQSQAAEQQPALCKDAGINIITINNQEDVCFTQDKLFLTVENNGNARIDGIKLSVIGENDIYQEDLPYEIKAGEIKRLEAHYIVRGSIRQIRIMPFIGNEKLCAKIFAKAEKIREC